ncbi:hypothetical protein BKA70DRAFT_1155529 [Coprinopsis sp. MPI-PUGE-AT-0042]|nr:hypothetical protein BKA70DRAFT_1155529 [Coprinopsis sp. MPI-PUGE-AT-0042]
MDSNSGSFIEPGPPSRDHNIGCEGGTTVDTSVSSAPLDVFSNQDLVHKILEMLRDSLDAADIANIRRSCQRELYQLLFVNKSFFENTIEFLWEVMHSLLPCFSLIPSFKAKDTGYTFDRIHDPEWDRFHVYATHIKHFNFESPSPFEQLSEHWLSFLLRKSARTSLFPSLKTITCSYEARGAVRLLPLGFGPQLQRLSFAIRSATSDGHPYAIPDDWESNEHDLIDGDQTAGLLADVKSFASDIESLIYQGPITMAVMQSLSSLAQLTELKLTITSYNDVNDVYSLNDLRHLRTLKLSILSSWGPNNLSRRTVQKPPVDSLPSLRHLDVVACAWTMKALTFAIAPTNLKSFRHRLVDLQYRNNYLYHLSNFLGVSEDLQHIDIATRDNVHADGLGELSDQDTFTAFVSRLIRQGKLSQVGMTGLPLNGISTREAYRVGLCGKNMSRLTSFRYVPQGHGVDQKYYATPEALQDLAFKGCKTIKQLELRFQDTSFHTMPPLPVQRSSHPLQELHIVTEASDNQFDLTLRQKFAIAMFLDCLFPSLSRVSGSAGALWEDINALIESYQISRRYHHLPVHTT